MKKSIVHLFFRTAARAAGWTFLLALLAGCRPSDMIMAVGTYTDSGSYGVYLCELKASTMSVAVLDSAAQANPSFLCFSPDRSCLYAVTETEDSTAGVTAYSIDKKSKKLRKLNSISGIGAAPCYVATNGAELITSEYGGGSFTRISLTGSGALGAIIQHHSFNEGDGNLPYSRIHSAQYSPDGLIYMTDLGRDRMYVLRQSAIIDTIAFAAGFGPRHFCFNKDRSRMYVVGELSGKVCAARRDGETYLPEQYLLADTTSGKTKMGSADVHISSDGRFLYASNRLGGDGVAVFDILQNGLLEKRSYCQTGSHPRNFTLTSDGKWVIVACRDSDEIEFFSRDSKSGQLALHPDLTLRRFKKPVCIGL